MRRLAPLILLAAAVVATGCGSSSDGSTSETAAATDGGGSLSRAEFIAEADALCEASKARQAPLRKRVDALARTARGEERASGGDVSDETRRELAATLGQIVAMAEAGLAKVQELGPPQADADLLESIFHRTESAFESSRAYTAALEGHEDAKAQALAEKGDAETTETAALAKRYGFKVCGSRP